MSKAEEQNNKRPKDKEAAPTRSFNDSTLGQGSQIGQFRIERELGRGGMGVVYLAHDTKLDRPVAIKSLPLEVIGNPKVLSRWQREARLLASLNHPNIATIHEVYEEPNGAGYLVLEYIPGQTLADRLRVGPMPLDEALSVFEQVAEALEAAHQAGIIHRDLKPANIKITDEARVKLLDFGIAKEFGEQISDQDSTITQPGKIIGTPAYMSPEQARGQPADKRTDIWAFGCCFYESLTGKCAFEGATDFDALAKVLEREPDWNALPQKTPMRIRRILWRCLEKDPRRRLRDISEAWFEISETQSGTSEAFALPGDVAAVSRLSLRHIILIGLVCLVVGVLIASTLFKSFTRPTPPSPPTVSRLSISIPPDKPLYLLSTPLRFLALSPDGTRLVYVGEPDYRTTQLYTRSMDDLEVKPIPGTWGAHNPFFSPDGQWIGFFTDDLKKVSLAGGEPLTLLKDVPWGMCTFGSWADDGTIVFDAGRVIQRISADGGTPETLIAPDPPESRVDYQFPQVLPGGNAILYTNVSNVEVFLPETGERQTVLNNAHYALFVNSGHLIFLRNSVPMAVPFDVEQLKVTGPSVPLIEDIRLDSAGNVPQIAISHDGTMVYASAGSEFGETPLVWVDRQGLVEPLAVPARNYLIPRLSPDGKQIAVTIRAEGFENQVHLYDISRGALTQLTTEGSNILPQWSPDGMRVVFRSNRPKESGVYWKVVDGSAPAELLAGELVLLPCSWSLDGKLLACTTHNVNTQDDIWILPLDGDRKPQPFIKTQAREYNPTFSPDCRWLAYSSNESGRTEVYLLQYPDRGRKIQVSTDGGIAPVWSRDGRELYYARGNQIMVVQITQEPDLNVGMPEPLFEGPYEMGGNYGQGYDVSLDGRKFLMVKKSDDPGV